MALLNLKTERYLFIFALFCFLLDISSNYTSTSENKQSELDKNVKEQVNSVVVANQNNEENEEIEVESLTENKVKKLSQEEIEHIRNHHHIGSASERGLNNIPIVQIKTLSWKPRIVLIRNVIDDEDIVKIKSHCLDQGFVDKTCDINEKTAGDVFTKLTGIASQLSHLPPAQQEFARVMRLQKNDLFQSHRDYFSPEDLQKDGLKYAGNRVITALFVVEHPEKGGEIVFPELELEFMVEPGDLLLVYSTEPDGSLNPNSLYGTNMVVEGGLWMVFKYFREANVQNE